MKIKDNCDTLEFRCPFLVPPLFQAGFNRRKGKDTWWSCDRPLNREKRYLRFIKSCDFAADPKGQKAEFKIVNLNTVEGVK